MGKSGALATDTVSAMEIASENLEVLEVSADLSEQLNKDSAAMASAHKEQLEGILGVSDDES